MNLHGFIKGSDNPKQTRKYEYKYIKDELLDGKDCILVKKVIILILMTMSPKRKCVHFGLKNLLDLY